MAYKISADCIGCNLCTKLCPVGAISAGASGRNEIDPDKCAECGTCYENCPVEAIEEAE